MLIFHIVTTVFPEGILGKQIQTRTSIVFHVNQRRIMPQFIRHVFGSAESKGVYHRFSGYFGMKSQRLAEILWESSRYTREISRDFTHSLKASSQFAKLKAGPCSSGFTMIYLYEQLVGGFKHFLFSIIYGIILPIDFHIYFSRWLKPPTRQVVDVSHSLKLFPPRSQVQMDVNVRRSKNLRKAEGQPRFSLGENMGKHGKIKKHGDMLMGIMGKWLNGNEWNIWWKIWWYTLSGYD